MTRADRLFEAWCRQARIRCCRIPETSEKRPDYEIFPNDLRIVVEVKQLDPNGDEKALLARQAQGEIVVFGSTPGERIRREIREANRQIRKLTLGRAPALLVVLNNTPCSLHTEPYAVMTAMQGIDTIDVVVPRDSREAPKFGPTRSGKERAMRPDANTSVSAVGILERGVGSRLNLSVFHNRFARCPVDPDQLRRAGTRHFGIPLNARNSLDGWEEL